MNWFQISEKIPSLFVIMSHRMWDSEDGRSGKKAEGSRRL